MVDSWYCLDWFVPEGISQVSRRSEVGNAKRRSLNTRLSSGTSAGTFVVSAGPYRNYHAKTGTKNEPWHVFGTISIKGLENRSSRFEPKNSWLSFSRGSGPPLKYPPRWWWGTLLPLISLENTVVIPGNVMFAAVPLVAHSTWILKHPQSCGEMKRWTRADVQFFLKMILWLLLKSRLWLRLCLLSCVVFFSSTVNLICCI